MTNLEYLEKLKGLIEVHEHFGREPGTGKTRVDLLLAQLAANPTSPTESERSATIQQAHDAYNMLTNYQEPLSTRFHSQDGGISFYTNGQPGHTNGRDFSLNSPCTSRTTTSCNGTTLLMA